MRIVVVVLALLGCAQALVALPAVAVRTPAASPMRVSPVEMTSLGKKAKAATGKLKSSSAVRGRSLTHNSAHS